MTTVMDKDRVEEFAREWIAAWNRKDLEQVLVHFADDVQFTSPTAAVMVGTPIVVGKDSLRAYWQAAIVRTGTLHFTLDHVVWDAERDELVILYTSVINDQRKRACEWMRFDAMGRVVAAEALYGAVV